MKTKPTTKTTRDTKPKTASQLAAILGVSRQLVAYHRKNPLAPKSFSDVAAWMTFIEEISRDASLPAPLKKEMAKERLRLVKANADKIEGENKVRNEQLIDFEKVQKFIQHMTAVVFFGELSRLEYEFPASLKGKSELEIQDEVKGQISRIKKTIAIQVDQWVEKKGKV